MGKSVRERLNETIRRDKLEINEYSNKSKQGDIVENKAEEEIKSQEVIQDNSDITKMLDDNEIIKGLVEGSTKLKDDLPEEDEDLEEENLNGKKLAVILIVLIISLSTILVLWSNGYEIVNFAFNKVSEINESKEIEEKNEIIESESVAVSPMDLTECYEKVHYMANTIIIADDGQVWGQSEISRDSVNEMINELRGQDDYLSDELKKWLSLDFSNGVEVHNYVWNKLDGNIGKAKELDEEKIQQVIKIMKE